MHRIVRRFCHRCKTGWELSAGRSSRLLQFHVLQWPRVREAADQVDARLLHARADAPDERQLVDRDVGHPVVEDLLDLVQQRLALLHVQLPDLTLEEILDLGDDAGRISPTLADVRLEPRGRIATRAADADDHVFELAVAPGRGQSRALHGPDLRADPDSLEVPGQRLAHRDIGRPRIAGVEAVRIARVGEEAPGLRGVVGVRLEELRELQRARDQRPGDLREAKRLGLVERLPVDGVARGLAYAPVVPGRLRGPLVREIEPENRGRYRARDELESGTALNVLGHGAGQEIGDVDLAVLEGGRARRLLRQTPKDQSLDVGDLAPVPLERFHHQLDPGIEAHEFVRSGADRRLLEAVVTHLLDVSLGHDPAGAGGRRTVERHEVRPRLLQEEAHAARSHALDLAHALLEDLRPRALVPLEGELRVRGRDRLAVVELRALANDELVREPVLRLRERLREARGVEASGYGLHQRVVQGVEHHEGRGDPLGLTGVEPARGQRDVDAPGHGARRPRRPGRGRAGDTETPDDRHEGSDAA